MKFKDHWNTHKVAMDDYGCLNEPGLLAFLTPVRVSWWLINGLYDSGQWQWDETILYRVRWGWVLAHIGLATMAVWSTHAELVHRDLIRTEGAEWAPDLPTMAWLCELGGFALFLVSPVILYYWYEDWQRQHGR